MGSRSSSSLWFGSSASASASLASAWPQARPVHALRQQIAHVMLHTRRVPPVGQHGAQTIQQAEPPVRRLEQDGAAIRTAVRLGERGHERAIDEVGEENRLC